MSHVDEGALHAYLDGVLDEYPPADAERIRGHLDHCASCSERLVVERRIRSDAQAMLAMAVPDVEKPSFEELRAYVERTRVRPSASRRLSRLGWAASVVVAVGAGWMLRDGQLEQTRIMDRSIPAVGSGAAALAESVVSGSGEEPDEVAKSATEPAEDLVATSAEPSENAVTPSAPLPESRMADRVDSPGRNVVEPARTEPAGTAMEVDLPAVPEEGDAVTPATGVRSASGESGDRTMLDARTMRIREALPPAAEAVDASESRLADDGATASSERSADSPEVAVPGLELEDVATSDTPDADAEARAAAGAPVVVTSARAVGPGARFRDTEGVDRDDLPDEPRLSVPGLEVLEVTNLVAERSYLGGRVLQRQDDGSIIEVINLEPGVGLSVLPPLAAGHREARAEVASGWVVVRGALDEDTLSRLLAQLLPAGW